MTTIIIFILLIFVLFVMASVIDGELEAQIDFFRKSGEAYQPA